MTVGIFLEECNCVYYTKKFATSVTLREVEGTPNYREETSLFQHLCFNCLSQIIPFNNTKIFSLRLIDWSSGKDDQMDLMRRLNRLIVPNMGSYAP